MSAIEILPRHAVGPAHGTMGGRARMLKRLFDFFEQHRVEYCVVGDTRGLPEYIHSDVDVVVSQQALGRLPDLLAGDALGAACRLVQMIQHEPTAYFFVFACQEETGETSFLQADICSDYYRNGHLLLRASELLKGRRKKIDAWGQEKGFYVAEPAKEFIYYLLKKVEKQHLDPEQGAHLSAQWHQNPLGASAQLKHYWPEAECAFLAKSARTNRWEAVRYALPVLQTALHRSLPVSMADILGEWKRRVRRVWRPTGLFIAFLGPDGSGKSSIIEWMATDQNPMFWGSFYMHLRPSLGEKTHHSVPVTDPHAQPPRSLFASVAKLGYYLFDYNVGYLGKVWPQLVRSKVVISDRYYHDLLVDPRRYRYGGPAWLVLLMAKLLPLPDVFFFLDAPPEVLQSRKSEVPFEETARQRDAYLALARTLPNARVIDVSRPLHEVVGSVERIVLEVMAQRRAHG